MKNFELAQILYQIADILELQEVQFKPRTYQKAAQTIEALSEDIGTIYQKGGVKALEELPGIGQSIALKIEEFIKTGKIKYYQELKKQIPINLEELSQIPGLGPKKIRLLYQKLKIKNLKDLEKAIKQKKLRDLPSLGELTEENLQKGIEFAKKKTSRLLLGYAYPLAQEIRTYLLKAPGVSRVEIAGSFRRGQETIGDLDILALSSQPQKAMAAFIRMPDVKEVLAKGSTKSVIRLSNNLEVDLRVLKEKEFGSALLYFTGNKQHNIAIRKIALKKGWTLSEYGLFNLKTKKLIASRTEEEIYQKLGLQFIPPELRNNTGEIEAALKNKLPPLVSFLDIRADFQMHSRWSDGANSIREMAEQAARNGLKVIALTDHIGNLGVTNSLKRKRFENYLKEIDKINRQSDITILKGAEIDIGKEGRLVVSQEMLKKLDIVLAAVHLGYKGSEEEQTKRVCYALENYPIDVLAHPTGRKINEREPLSLNMEKLFETAKQTNTFLEINGMPERMDLKDNYIRAAKEIGCRFSLGSDAHSASQLACLKFSVINARRGWLEKKDTLNTYPLVKIRKILKNIKK